MPRAWAATWASTTRPSGGWASSPTRCGARRRLVVDTGIHAFGWDKARAIAFMRDNTALTDANIEAEVNRYISWPGQALGYMIGRLKILELRHRAEQALGERFDVRRFHDAVLRNGSVPLDVLEAEIDAWIAAERQRR